ncbi:hypothetical protein HPY86_01795 [candidate division WOR-3 bacterium]|nr:hypothetical protein [candidate division WOR-3 bacterium]
MTSESEKGLFQKVTRWIHADRFLKGLHRVNIFVGGYGSGKSEMAVNFAISLAGRDRPVKIGDLDIVNPYFRSREARTALKEFGVELLLPPPEIMESDLPLIQPEIVGALQNPNGFLVLDIGGDPIGAKVLASIRGKIPNDDFDCFFVLNSRRPFSATVADVKKMVEAVENASEISVTQLVVNSHLIDETSVAVIEEGIELAEAVRNETNKVIGFVAVERRMLNEFDAGRLPYPVLVLDRWLLKPWETREKLGSEKFKL